MARLRIMIILETKVLDMTALAGVGSFLEPHFVSAFNGRRGSNAVLCAYLVC